MTASAVQAEIETNASVVVVTAGPGGAGQVIPVTASTSSVTIDNPAIGGLPIEYSTPGIDWLLLEKGQAVRLAIDLSSTPVWLRKATSYGGSPSISIVTVTVKGIAESTGNRRALADALSRTPTLPLRRRWGVLGDSISAQAALTSGPTTRGWAANSYVTWLRRYLADAIDLPTERVYALANATVGQPHSDGQDYGNTVIDGQVPRALADKLDVALVHMGTNSVASVDAATLIAQCKAVYDALFAGGIFVVAVPIRVRGAVAQWATTAKVQEFAQVNRFIADYAFAHSGQMLCVDVNPVLMDFSTGVAKAGLYVDSLHDNAPSAQIMGRAIADVIRPLMPQMDRRFLHPLDVFHPVDNPSGNLIGNGAFAGTNGNSAINGSTGQSADGWDVGRNNGNSTTSVVGGKEIDPVYAGLVHQTVTFGGNADGSTSFLAYFFNDTSNFAAGDRVYFEVECLAAMTTETLGGITAVLDVQDAGYSGVAASFDGLYQAGFGALPTNIGSFVLRTESLVLPAGFRYIAGRVQFQPLVAGAIGGKLTFSRAAMRKVLG